MEGEIHSGSPSVGGTPPIVGEGWVQFEGPASQKITFDKLTRAEQEKIVSSMISPQMPILAPPENYQVSFNMQVGSISSADPTIENEKSKIIRAMLDHWIQSIQKNAELARDEEQKRSIERIDNLYSSYKAHVDPAKDENFNIFAVGLIISATGIQQALMPVVNSGGLEFNPVVDMCMQTAPMMGDMRAELGLLGAIYAVGLQYFTNAAVASEAAGKKNSEEIDLAFAEKYGENVLKLIGSASFNTYLAALVTSGTEKGEPLSERRVSELVAMMKLVLVASALATLYKAEAGKMIGLEFASMIMGEMPFEEGSLYSSLVLSIRAQLKDISSAVQEKLLASLMEYFDSDPALENLSDPAKVFSSLYVQLPRGDLSG